MNQSSPTSDLVYNIPAPPKPSSNPIESLDDLQTLFAMMGTYGIAIVEFGDLKVVKAPDSAPTIERDARPAEPVRPGPIHADPFLYSDGVVPDFEQR